MINKPKQITLYAQNIMGEFDSVSVYSDKILFLLVNNHLILFFITSNWFGTILISFGLG